MQITAKTKAWLTDEYTSFADLQTMPPERAVSKVAYYPIDMTTAGWVCVGEATVTLDLVDDKAATHAQLDRLNKKLTDVRADNQQRENAILLQISKLQALTYDAEPA